MLAFRPAAARLAPTTEPVPTAGKMRWAIGKFADNVR
jgi:hypothetical protein